MSTISRALSLLVLALPVLALPACGDDDPAPAATPAAETCKGIVKSSTGNCSEEMFCKYGLTAFQAVNESIIKRATATGIEAELGDSFVKLVNNPDPKKVPAFKNNLAIFLVNAYGGDKTVYKYEGADMKTAHAGLQITEAQYNAFVSKVIVPALQDNGVPEADINNCFAPPVTSAAFIADIVAK